MARVSILSRSRRAHGLVGLVVALIAGVLAPSSALSLTVSLGDSYSSGEGAGPFDPITNVRGDRCHRSANAWPRLLGVSPVAHLACSGATTLDFTSGQEKRFPDNLSQLDRLKKLAVRNTIDRVYVTVGGNDLGFGSIIRDCVIKDCLKRMDAVELKKLREKVRPRVSAALLGAREASGQAEVVLVGYPDLIPSSNDQLINCGWLTPEEADRVRRLEAELDSTLRGAADDAQVFYVPVRAAFFGHELCTVDSWVRPVGTAAVEIQQQGHPNRQGQFAFRAAVRTGLAAQRLLYVSQVRTVKMQELRTNAHKVTAVSATSPVQQQFDITTSNSDIFWMTDTLFGSDGTVFRASIDGRNPQQILASTVAAGLGEVTDLTFSRGRLWLLTHRGVASMKIDGSDLQTDVYSVPTDTDEPGIPSSVESDGQIYGVGAGLDSDDRYLYIARCKSGTIGRVDLETGQVDARFMRPPGDRCWQGVAATRRYLFLFEPDFASPGVPTEGRIARARIDGSGLRPNLIKFGKAGDGGFASIAADSQYIYWDYGFHRGRPPMVARARVDGGGIDWNFLPKGSGGGLALTPAP